MTDRSRLFVVLRSRGPGWKWSLPLEGQEEWAAHAAFMDGLYAEKFALLVGPLDTTGDAPLVVRAGSADQIEARLAGDPWSRTGLLQTVRIEPWTLRLGSLP